MLALLKSLFVDQPHAGAHAAYIALVTQARNHFFYESMGVPDTIDGRFEMIVLHLFLLQHRMLEENAATPRAGRASHEPAKLRGGLINRSTRSNETEDFGRSLSELFFADMDRSVRELGVADTGVRYRIKAMAKAYHGRLQAYTVTMDDPEQLRAALARNLYGTVADGSVDMLVQASDYIQRARKALTAADSATIISGGFSWPDPATK